MAGASNRGEGKQQSAQAAWRQRTVASSRDITMAPQFKRPTSPSARARKTFWKAHLGGTEAVEGAVLHAHCDDATAGALLIHYEVQRKVLHCAGRRGEDVGSVRWSAPASLSAYEVTDESGDTSRRPPQAAF